ncbi:MAG: GH1 family beta-glucosidase [candidate division KSB1 bacterium]|nr:GH1 family beta-glucosidase [candidate division KSB1 bacterium]MDZ7366555.1 GH1 family beta-glucosidase [candidate division KSB1 bacterium]MDZ7405962.1 GH1 family beta-glucosidase [candidate division KSB1 bacterium]
MNFPPDFVWGAAAASYQIEGGAYDDGKGLSVWDVMCKSPGKISTGDSGDVACDHYHRFEDDARLMGEIGLQAYRLSISWPRVLPNGAGAVNEKGLAFYDRLIDALLQNGVQPWVTLFHWDYPHALFCRGGWLNRDSADWFAEYAQIIIDKLSDRVAHWITQNEPQCYIGLGHQTGEHAPGLELGFAEVLRAAHHSLLAHGKAVQVIRARAKTPPLIGAAPVGIVKMPASNRPEDIAAARAATFAVSAKNCWSNTWFADPMIFGRYPEDGLKLFANEMPEIRHGDMETIGQPLDFYGINVYFGETVRAKADGGYERVKSLSGPPLTTMGWEVTPEALYWGPRFIYERYKLPIVVTENGMANCDWIQLEGKVHDPQRIDFLWRYLRAYKRALDDGVVATGYFVWSVMDNFEWGHGYKQRFGLIYVDYATQKRVLKDSAYWYREVIASKGGHIGNENFY